MPSLEKRSDRLPLLAPVLRILFALVLVGTGSMTISLGGTGYPVGDPPSKREQFMLSLQNTGYLIFWVGFLKTITGGLMFLTQTASLAILMALPSAFHILILLYVIFFAHPYLVIGIPHFAVCGLLIYGYFEWYRPIFAEATTASIQDSHGGEHVL